MSLSSPEPIVSSTIGFSLALTWNSLRPSNEEDVNLKVIFLIYLSEHISLKSCLKPQSFETTTTIIILHRKSATGGWSSTLNRIPRQIFAPTAFSIDPFACRVDWREYLVPFQAAERYLKIEIMNQSCITGLIVQFLVIKKCEFEYECECVCRSVLFHVAKISHNNILTLNLNTSLIQHLFSNTGYSSRHGDIKWCV
uniref:Uncharacterized protein n=1 Tax=Glossina palpalis gambiensis TaxID=67801 RepID=A0A1B0BU20_9MUSC